jgi:hypothetical protein
MPIIERRKLSKEGKSSHKLIVPKGWTDYFRIEGNVDVDVLADTPVVIFPPSVDKKEERIDALRKIIGHLEGLPERPFPKARAGRKKKTGETKR